MPRALHDFVASLDSRAYFTMAVFREFVLVFYKAKASRSSKKERRKKKEAERPIRVEYPKRVFYSFLFSKRRANAREKGEEEA